MSTASAETASVTPQAVHDYLHRQNWSRTEVIAYLYNVANAKVDQREVSITDGSRHMLNLMLIALGLETKVNKLNREQWHAVWRGVMWYLEAME